MSLNARETLGKRSGNARRGRYTRDLHIVITGHADVQLAVQAMKAGAADFIEKPFREDVLPEAVRAALNRESSVRRSQAGDARYQAMLDQLTPRQHEVLKHVFAGKTNKIIARECGISPRTVEVHRANIMSKTGVDTLSGLVRMALLARG